MCAFQIIIRIHRDVEVTDVAGEHGPLVSQAFCSRLQPRAAYSLGSIRIAGFTGSLRSHHGGRRTERTARPEIDLDYTRFKFPVLAFTEQRFL